MNDAELYTKNNSLQKRDALKCLEEYAKKMKWRRFDRVIDIGCGDGSLTTMLRNYSSTESINLVGTDISENMVKFANEHYADERTTFSLLDIEDKLTEELRGRFDHVFSFYALHWIRQQKLAFRNIYNLMGEGGDCLLLFIGHMPIYDVYRVLARNTKWSSFLKTVDNFVSPYHDSEYPDKEITVMMKEIGFHNIDVKCQHKQFAYNDVGALKNALAAVHPFDTPKNVFDDFMIDYMDVVKSMLMIDKKNNNIMDSTALKFTYDLIVVHAKKPIQ